MEISMEVPKTLNIELSSDPDPAILLLGIYLKESKISAHIHSTIHISKLWNQPRCPPTDEWIKKTYIYIMEYCTAIKKNKIMSFAGKWLELEIILSKLSQTQIQILHVFSHMQKSRFFFLKEDMK
jgi:hypothetical protein